MQETQVQSLDQEDLPEKWMVTHSSSFSWRIPWTEEPDRLQFMVTKSQTQLSDFHFHTQYTFIRIAQAQIQNTDNSNGW